MLIILSSTNKCRKCRIMQEIGIKEKIRPSLRPNIHSTNSKNKHLSVIDRYKIKVLSNNILTLKKNLDHSEFLIFMQEALLKRSISPVANLGNNFFLFEDFYRFSCFGLFIEKIIIHLILSTPSPRPYIA